MTTKRLDRMAKRDAKIERIHQACSEQYTVHVMRQEVKA